MQGIFNIVYWLNGGIFRSDNLIKQTKYLQGQQDSLKYKKNTNLCCLGSFTSMFSLCTGTFDFPLKCENVFLNFCKTLPEEAKGRI